MNKNDLFIHNGVLHRILSVNENRLFVINCRNLSMPFWLDNSEVGEQPNENLELQTTNIDSLPPETKKAAYKKYHLIAPILPFIEDQYMRSHLISRISEQNKISKQTIRKYLCSFLVHQDIGALAPQERHSRSLTQDEKNFRWALNKFYYSPLKHTIKGSYLLLLKEKYTNSDGSLKDFYPPFHRFKYFYSKTKKPQNELISRDGLGNYQRNHRPLVGGGVLEFASSIGVGMLDSTILDIYLVNDANELIGRPIFTACIDTYSSLCCGYALTWEGGFSSIKQLLHNVITDKVSLCKKFGITIDQGDWNCTQLPYTFVTDKGREYTSYALEQITDLGVNIINLPPYRPDLKSCVEQFFNVIQSLYKPHLKGKGVIEQDFQERGKPDYRKSACLTLNQLETILIKCIIFYNTRRIVERCPFNKENPIKPYANEIWNSSLKHSSANLISVNKELLTLTLLPRGKASFTRRGLTFRKLHYYADNFTNEFLTGGNAEIAYDPNNISNIWLLKEGNFIRFTLIDSYSKYESFDVVNALIRQNEKYLKSFESEEIQSRVALISEIEDIARVTKQNIRTHSVRKNRSKEKFKERRDS